MKADSEETTPAGHLLIYKDGTLQVQVRLDGETVWLPQRLIADLYQITVPTVNEHLGNIYDEGELEPEATIRKFRIVQIEGSRQVRRLVDHYNLDVILAIGYRVRSQRGTNFRQWATARLSEVLVKGFTLDSERIKEGRTLGDQYFEELLAQIRDIRASERLFYQKITDIYATSIDYDKNAEVTQKFFAAVQNKLHWAIHGHTAAELKKLRADAKKPLMGLYSWKNAPHGTIRKADVTVAKNYLDQDELEELNRIVTMYLDHAEDQARRRKPMHMADWVKRLDAFLEFNERAILTHTGKVSQRLADEHAQREYQKYHAQQLKLSAQQPTSDFDKVLEKVKRLEKAPAKVEKRARNSEANGS